ncbi:MAG: hypothetical protein M3135_08765, partial [Actinomycetota bacterium]|nr:hypothetical protein [Actinomycetota bacterium]
MRVRSLALVALTSAAIVIPPSTGPAVAVEGTHSENLTHLQTLAYPKHPDPTRPDGLRNAMTNGGTDIEFMTLEVPKLDENGNPICVVRQKKRTTECATRKDGSIIYRTDDREYALAGSYDNGLQLVDITVPTESRIVGNYDCAIRQGDVQVFRRGERTYATYTQDDPYNRSATRPQHYLTSDCYVEAEELGLYQPGVTNPAGTFIVDVTDPTNPTTVSFISVTVGSHNQTVAPGGRYLYNSNSDVGAVRVPSIEVYDISDFANPTQVKTLGPADGLTGLSSHDITFSENGDRAYSAAVTETLVLDTTDLANPKIIGRIVDPAVNIHHQSDPVTLTDATTGLTRTFLIVTDEIAGAAGNAICPGGGLHVYDITGSLENSPVKVGFWNIPSTRKTTALAGRCTSHVLRLHPDEGIMTIAWYNAGVRVVDISGLVGVSVGATETTGNVGAGMREIGFYYFPTSVPASPGVPASPSSETWAAKTNHIEQDGSFYLYGNDQNRGLDIYRFDGTAPESPNGGTWLTPAQSLELAQARGVQADPQTGPFCLYLGV